MIFAVAGAAKAPLEVKVVESGQVLGIPSPVLISLAAIVGAALAAGVAIWRMRNELTHDRKMRDREDRRNALDAAMEVADETFEAVTLFEGAVELADKRWESLQAVVDGKTASEAEKEEAKESISTLKERCAARRKAARERVPKMALQAMRLRLRFGMHEITRAYESLSLAHHELVEALVPGMKGSLTEEQTVAVKKADAAAEEQFNALMVACQRWFTQGDS